MKCTTCQFHSVYFATGRMVCNKDEAPCALKEPTCNEYEMSWYDKELKKRKTNETVFGYAPNYP